jgi:ribosomal protein S18 acetylase RimI-like enzyme
MFQTRYATQDDVPAIVALVESAYRGESSRQGWTTEADLLDGQRTDAEEVSCLLAQPDNYFLLHEQSSLQASLHLQNQSTQAYLGMFAVDPKCQGQGIGVKMLQRAEQIAFDEWGCDQLQMTVIRQREDLIAWYQRHGYRFSGEIRPFPYGNPRFGLPRRDDLQLHVLSKFATG